MVRLAFVRSSLIAALQLCAVAFTGLGDLNASPPQTREPVIGGPCEGCELVFEGRPAELKSTARITDPEVAGEGLTVTGTVRRPDGTPAPGIIVYAYQTDRTGVYPPGATRHGALRAWVRTDARGQYRLQTIRPGAYPQRRVPQHIHMHIIEPGRGTYDIANVMFDDDPLLTESHRAQQAQARGGPGLVTPKRDNAGEWRVTRDIVLGQNVPGYDHER